MLPMTRVDIFGTLHIDRPRKVKIEIDEFLGDVDVVFVEEPKIPSTPADEKDLLLRNPIMRITGSILNVFWGALGFLMTRHFGPVDRFIVDEFAEKQDVEIEPVDLNLVRRAADVSLPTTIGSWAWFVLTILLFAWGFLALLFDVTASLNILLFAAAIGFIPVAPFARLTLADRDREMAKNIEDAIRDRDDIDSACLVVGRGHMSGVVEKLEEKDVEIGDTYKSKWLRRGL